MCADSEAQKRNKIATQYAGIAVSYFLSDDRADMIATLRNIPKDPGYSVGLLRFAALAVSEIAAVEEKDPSVVAVELTKKILSLEQ